MQIKAANKDKLEATADLVMDETLEGLTEKYGAEIVASYCLRAIKIAAQNAMRLMLDCKEEGEGDSLVSFTEEQRVARAIEAGTNWVPPEPRLADPRAKAVRKIKAMSDEQKAAILEYMRSEGLV